MCGILVWKQMCDYVFIYIEYAPEYSIDSRNVSTIGLLDRLEGQFWNLEFDSNRFGKILLLLDLNPDTNNTVKIEKKITKQTNILYYIL